MRRRKKTRRDTGSEVAGDQREAVEDEVLMQDAAKAEPRRDLGGGSSRQDDTVGRRSMGAHRLPEPFDRADARLDGAARDRIRGAARKLVDRALGETQARGAAIERAAHELGAGNDQPAEEFALRGERI